MAHKEGKGMTGLHHSDETKLKLSFANRGKHHTKEAKLKMSLKRVGRPGPKEGKSHSEWSKMNMGLSRVGRPKSEEWKKKIGESNRGIKRLYASKNLKHGSGQDNSFYGKSHTEKTKQILRERRLTQKINRISSIELRLIEELNKSGIIYKAQVPISDICIPDIFIEPNICIFCDGDYWHNLPTYINRDTKINKLLKERNYVVLRFWEKEIKGGVSKCVDRIKEVIK